MIYKVAITEDHSLLSQALAKLVNSFLDFEVIYVCANGKELLSSLRHKKEKPDIVLMDVNMPIMGGLEATEHLTIHYPEIMVLALSVDSDEFTILKMLRAGARGYILKDSDSAVLHHALREVISVGVYYTKEVSKLIPKLSNFQDSWDHLFRSREQEFLKHACSEMTYKEIAALMNLSPKTIDGYRESLFKKLNVKSRTGLVLFAISNGIVSLDKK